MDLAGQGEVSRYDLSTKQNLGKRAFEIKDHGTGRVVWTTTRGLIGDEIVETVSDISTPSSSICSIHQPTRGWYLLIKSSDKAFTLAQPHVALQPSRSSNPTSEFRFTVKSSAARPAQDGPSGDDFVPLNFVLAAHAPDKDKKPVNRLSLRAITEVFASTRNSFSLFLDEAGVRKQILHFEDHPSLLHADTTGTLTLHENIAVSSGIDRTFFVTAAIAYLAFLEDQEAYKAAASG